MINRKILKLNLNSSNKFSSALKGFFKGFGILFLYECLEELLEEFIAFGIATIATKTLSFIILLIGTQLSKATLKGIALVLKQVIKKITYKAGADKMDKLKAFATKFVAVVRANKVSIAETVVNGGAWGGLAFLVTLAEDVAINVCGFNITPLFSIIGFILVEFGFQWESVETFLSRISPKLAKKLETKKETEAKKAEALAIKEKEKLIAQMKAEKKAEIEAMNAEKKAQEKAKAEEEARLAKEKEEKELAEWLASKEKVVVSEQQESVEVKATSNKIETPPKTVA